MYLVGEVVEKCPDYAIDEIWNTRREQTIKYSNNDFDVSRTFMSFCDPRSPQFSCHIQSWP